MKKIFILGFAAAFLFSSCEKDLSSSKVSTNKNPGTTLSEANIPTNFDWRTTQQVSIDLSNLSGSDAEQLVQIEDSHGNLLLTKLMKLNEGEKIHLQLPISEKALTLTHNGIKENVKVANGVGSIFVMKGGGYPDNAPCPCESRMENVTFQYSGANGANLTVWYKDKGNTKSQSHSFPNLTTGDIISVNGWTTMGNSGNTPRLMSQTFLSLDGGQTFWNVHTSCSEYILGNIYGPFKVIAFTDGHGRTCSDQCVDTDGDGCCDDDDEFPLDPTKCDIQYLPGENVYGSYAFEDLWPATGDFDFNDKVIDRTTSLVLDPNGDVIEAQHKFVLKAAGAGYKNGFGFAMPNTTPAEITSVTSSYAVPGDYTTIDAKGLEAGQTQAVVILYENWNHIAHYTQGGSFFNTIPGGGAGYADTITVDVVFAVPQVITDVLEIDPFVIRNRNRGAEIHLPWFGPTDLADPTIFNTFKDASGNTAVLPNYVTANNVPWGIETPLSAFAWPIEKVNIADAYYDIISWATTGTPTDWYSNGNNDPTKIY